LLKKGSFALLEEARMLKQDEFVQATRN